MAYVVMAAQACSRDVRLTGLDIGGLAVGSLGVFLCFGDPAEICIAQDIVDR